MNAGDSLAVGRVPAVPDFDQLYAANPDPWAVASGEYETRKREILLALLSRRHYRHGWDPACGTGHLVAELAERCDSVLATDGSVAAVELTRALCVGRWSVTVRPGLLPEEPTDRPGEGFDLVVLAEFFYYLDAEDRRKSMEIIRRSAAAGCELLSVHWRPKPHDGWLSGAEVQTEIGADLTGAGWLPGLHLDDPDFVVDSWHRPAGPA